MRSDIRPGGIFPDYALPDHTNTMSKLSELHAISLTRTVSGSVKAGQPATGDRPGATSPGCYDAPQSGIP